VICLPDDLAAALLWLPTAFVAVGPLGAWQLLGLWGLWGGRQLLGLWGLLGLGSSMAAAGEIHFAKNLRHKKRARKKWTRQRRKFPYCSIARLRLAPSF